MNNSSPISQDVVVGPYKYPQFSPNPMAFFSSDEKNPRIFPIPVIPGSLPPGFSPFKPALVHALFLSQCWVPP